MSNWSSYFLGVTKKANIPDCGNATAVMEYECKAGEQLEIPKLMQVVMKLYKAGGIELNRKTKIYWAIKTPAEDVWTKITDVERYNAWKDLTLDKQRNTDFNGTLKFRFDKLGTALMQQAGGSTGIRLVKDRKIALFIETVNSEVLDPTSDDLIVEITNSVVLGH